MSVHYLEKYEPKKLAFQLCCMPYLDNDGDSACYIIDIHKPILIILCRQ